MSWIGTAIGGILGGLSARDRARSAPQTRLEYTYDLPDHFRKGITNTLGHYLSNNALLEVPEIHHPGAALAGEDYDYSQPFGPGLMRGGSYNLRPGPERRRRYSILGNALMPEMDGQGRLFYPGFQDDYNTSESSSSRTSRERQRPVLPGAAFDGGFGGGAALDARLPGGTGTIRRPGSYGAYSGSRQPMLIPFGRALGGYGQSGGGWYTSPGQAPNWNPNPAPPQRGPVDPRRRPWRRDEYQGGNDDDLPIGTDPMSNVRGAIDWAAALRGLRGDIFGLLTRGPREHQYYTPHTYDTLRGEGIDNSLDNVDEVVNYGLENQAEQMGITPGELNQRREDAITFLDDEFGDTIYGDGGDSDMGMETADVGGFEGGWDDDSLEEAGFDMDYDDDEI